MTIDAWMQHPTPGFLSHRAFESLMRWTGQEPPKDPIPVTQRIIVNYYTAKRLLAALSMSIQRHEAVFGVLETNVQKRVKMPNR